MMAVLEQSATFTEMLMDVRRKIRGYWVDRSRPAIERWQAEGLVDGSIDRYYAATSLGAMVNRSAYVWMVLGEPYDEDIAVRAADAAVLPLARPSHRLTSFCAAPISCTPLGREV